MVEKKKAKQKTKRKVSSGIAHIVSSFNNTIITISDQNEISIDWNVLFGTGPFVHELNIITKMINRIKLGIEIFF